MKAYIAGPMRGIEKLNFPAFNHAEKVLKREGYKVVNPAKINEAPGAPWEECMKADIKELLTCDCIFVLSGWEKSKGAQFEVYIGRMLGMAIVDYNTKDYLLSDVKMPLEYAQKLVHGDRQANYGHPIKDFTKVANLWNAIFPHWKARPQDVPLAMICIKLSREEEKHKTDNLTDIAGYAETCEMVHRKLSGWKK